MTYRDNEELIKRYRNGEYNLRNQIIENNLLLVKKIVKIFSNYYDDEEDLFQVGCLGLIYSLDKYEIDCNTKFGTYAFRNVYYYILDYINQQKHLIYIPKNLINQLIKYNKYKNQNFSNLEIAHKMKLCLNELKKLIKVYDQIEDISYFSLDQSIYDDQNQLIIDYLGENDNNIDNLINLIYEEQLFEYLRTWLDEKKFNIIYMYYKNEMTFEEIANYYGVTKQCINTQHKRILKRLRNNKIIENFNR